MKTLNFIVNEKNPLGIWSHDVYQHKMPSDSTETLAQVAAGVANAAIRLGAEQVDVLEVLGKHTLPELRFLSNASFPYQFRIYQNLIGHRWTFKADDFISDREGGD